MFQSEITSGETNDVSVPQENKDTRATRDTWRQNNAEIISFETNNRAANPPHTIVDGTSGHQERRTDDILEDQRKNSKNEINAKLNNQEHNLEAERQDEKKRKVRRIDLKAYGFENEFSVQTTVQPQQRMVNRLDLRSFGYQDGLRRARSNNQLDQPMDNEKSNLTRCTIDREKHRVDYMEFGRGDLTKSSEALNQLHENAGKVSSLVSAKSMPNVADDAYYYANPVQVSIDDDNNNDDYNEEEEDKFFSARNSLNRASDESDREAVDERNANDYDETSSDLDRSFEDIYIANKDQCFSQCEADEKLPMPSVKRLAEAFDGRQTFVAETVPMKANKTLVINETNVSFLLTSDRYARMKSLERPRHVQA